jgi:hypothetical protein
MRPKNQPADNSISVVSPAISRLREQPDCACLTRLGWITCRASSGAACQSEDKYILPLKPGFFLMPARNPDALPRLTKNHSTNLPHPGRKANYF